MNDTNQPQTTMINSPMADVLKVHGVMTSLATAATEVHEAGDYAHVIVPKDYKREDITDLLEKARPTPNRKRGTVQLKDLTSLLLYCDDQAAAATNFGNEIETGEGAATYGYIYADPDARKIVAVFNDQRGDVPGWRDHRAEYKAEFTPEFAKWLAQDKKQMDQTAFAEWIEDNMVDVTEPAATTLLEMATTIQAKTDINFSSAKRLQNGQVQLQYTEVIDARAGANGALEIPKEFALGLRIFKNGEGYKIKARLKYRLHGGTVKFWYELDRVERAIEDAFDGYVVQLREKSGYVVLLGTP